MKRTRPDTQLEGLRRGRKVQKVWSFYLSKELYLQVTYVMMTVLEQLRTIPRWIPRPPRLRTLLPGLEGLSKDIIRHSDPGFQGTAEHYPLIRGYDQGRMMNWNDSVHFGDLLNWMTGEITHGFHLRWNYSVLTNPRESWGYLQ